MIFMLVDVYEYSIVPERPIAGREITLTRSSKDLEVPQILIPRDMNSELLRLGKEICRQFDEKLKLLRSNLEQEIDSTWERIVNGASQPIDKVEVGLDGLCYMKGLQCICTRIAVPEFQIYLKGERNERYLITDLFPEDSYSVCISKSILCRSFREKTPEHLVYGHFHPPCDNPFPDALSEGDIDRDDPNNPEHFKVRMLNFLFSMDGPHPTYKFFLRLSGSSFCEVPYQTHPNSLKSKFSPSVSIESTGKESIWNYREYQTVIRFNKQ